MSGFDFGDLEPEEDAEEQPLPLLTFDEAEKVPLPPVDPPANEGFRKPGRRGYAPGTDSLFDRPYRLHPLARGGRDS